MSILDLFDYINRPLNAVTTGIAEGTDPYSDTGFLGGFYEGLMGQKHTTASEALGLPTAQPEDEWVPWLGKSALDLGVSIPLDPLTYIPFAKALKWLGTGIKHTAPGLARGADRLYELTGLHKAFSHDMGSEAANAASEAYRRALRGGQRQVFEDLERSKAAEAAAGVDDLLDPRHLYERKLYDQLPDPIREAYDIQHSADLATFQARNEMAGYWGLPETGPISEEVNNFISRVPTEQFSRQIRSAGMPIARGLEGWKRRELVKLIDVDTGDMVRQLDPGMDFDIPVGGGSPVPRQSLPLLIHKTDTRLKPADRMAEEGPELFDFNGRLVKQEPVTLKEIEEWRPDLKGRFVKGAAESMAVNQLKSLGQLEYMRLLKGLMDAGELVPIRGDDVALNVMPKGMREVRLPKLSGSKKGLEGERYMAPWRLADVLENEARQSGFDTSTPMGALSQVLHGLANSKAGDMLGDVTRVWKRLTLGHPGWAAANEISNLAQIYLSKGGLRTFASAPAAIRLMTGRGGQVIPGITNEQLSKEALDRGLGQGVMFVREAKDRLREIVKGEAWPNTIDRIPVAGSVKRGFSRMLDKVFEVGQLGEQHAKYTVFIDNLIHDAPNFARMTKEQQTVALDKAAREAQDALIEYRYTPTEESLSKIFVPFLGWLKGITERTAKLAVTHPEKLARLGRFYDAIAEPLPDQDKAIADDWVKEGGPIVGMFGSRFPMNQGGLPSMLMAGRFIPQGTVEQLLKAPAKYISSSINPYLKGPVALATNFNEFKERPIDQVAGGFPANLLNPWFGLGPYELAPAKYFGQSVSSGTDYLMNTLNPFARFVGEAKQLGSAVAHAVGAEEYVDPYRGAMSLPEAATWYGTGGRYYGYDRDKWLMRRQKKADIAESALKRNITYAAKRGDNDAVEFYRLELLDMLNDRARNLIPE